MLNFLGMMVGNYIFYVIFSLIFRHKIGFIISSIAAVGSGLTQLFINLDPTFIFAALGAILCIYFIVPIQIRSDKKKKKE